MNRREFVGAAIAVGSIGAIPLEFVPAAKAYVIQPLNSGMLFSSDILRSLKINTDRDPVGAGTALSAEWAKHRYDNVDMWGLDNVCSEMIEAFFTECKRRGLLREALKTNWHFHCCPGPEEWTTLYDIYPEWVKDFLNRTEGKSYPVNPTIHREDSYSLMEMACQAKCHFEKERADRKAGINQEWRDLA